MAQTARTSLLYNDKFICACFTVFQFNYLSTTSLHCDYGSIVVLVYDSWCTMQNVLAHSELKCICYTNLHARYQAYMNHMLFIKSFYVSTDYKVLSWISGMHMSTLIVCIYWRYFYVHDIYWMGITPIYIVVRIFIIRMCTKPSTTTGESSMSFI